MSLRSFRDALLTHKHPDEVLRLADKYLTQMEELREDFVLPATHKIITPVLEYYFRDLAGWMKFVKGVRDHYPRTTEEFSKLQEFFRVLTTRKAQQDRRERLDFAVAQAVKLRLITDDYETKMRYVRRCTQAWKLRRDAMLDGIRAKTKSGRVSTEEREELLTAFWDGIWSEIEQGNLPTP